MTYNKKGPEKFGAYADWTGLEPATSAVTGRHSNQLNYQSLVYFYLDNPLTFPLEPVSSQNETVTGRHSNQLNYQSLVYFYLDNPFDFPARTRLVINDEAVTGRHSNQLNYQSKKFVPFF
jgi:hypothetical protein